MVWKTRTRHRKRWWLSSRRQHRRWRRSTSRRSATILLPIGDETPGWNVIGTTTARSVPTRAHQANGHRRFRQKGRGAKPATTTAVTRHPSRDDGGRDDVGPERIWKDKTRFLLENREVPRSWNQTAPFLYAFKSQVTFELKRRAHLWFPLDITTSIHLIPRKSDSLSTGFGVRLSSVHFGK